MEAGPHSAEKNRKRKQKESAAAAAQGTPASASKSPAKDVRPKKHKNKAEAPHAAAVAVEQQQLLPPSSATPKKQKKPKSPPVAAPKPQQGSPASSSSSPTSSISSLSTSDSEQPPSGAEQLLSQDPNGSQEVPEVFTQYDPPSPLPSPPPEQAEGEEEEFRPKRYLGAYIPPGSWEMDTDFDTPGVQQGGSSSSASSSSEEDEEEGEGGSGVVEEVPDLSGVVAGREELWVVRLPPKVPLSRLRGAVLSCPAEGPLSNPSHPLSSTASKAPRLGTAAAVLAQGRGLGQVSTSALQAAAEKEAKEQGPPLDKAADAFSPTGDMPVAGSRQYGDYQQYVANEPGQPTGLRVAPPVAPEGQEELGRLRSAAAKKPRHRTWCSWRLLQEHPTLRGEVLVVGDTGSAITTYPKDSNSGDDNSSSSDTDKSESAGEVQVVGLRALRPTRLVVMAADTEVINSKLPGLLWGVSETVAAAQGWPLLAPCSTTTEEEPCQQLMAGLNSSRLQPDGLGQPLRDPAADDELVGVNLGGGPSREETAAAAGGQGGEEGEGEPSEVQQQQVADGYYHSVRLRRWEAARRRYQRKQQKQQEGAAAAGGAGGGKDKGQQQQQQGLSWDPLWQLRQDWDEAEQGPGGAPGWTLDGPLTADQAPHTNGEQDWQELFHTAELAYAGAEGARTAERRKRAAQRELAVQEAQAAAAAAAGKEPKAGAGGADTDRYVQPHGPLLWGARGEPQPDQPDAAAQAAAAAAEAAVAAAVAAVGPQLEALLDSEVVIGEEGWVALVEGPAAVCGGDAAEEEEETGKLDTPWYPQGPEPAPPPPELPEELLVQAGDLLRYGASGVRRQLADAVAYSGLGLDAAAGAAAAASSQQPAEEQQQQQGGGGASADSSHSSSGRWWQGAGQEEWQAWLKAAAAHASAGHTDMAQLDALLVSWGLTLQQRLEHEEVGLTGHYEGVLDLPLLPATIWQSAVAPRMAVFLNNSSLLPRRLRQGRMEPDPQWWGRFLTWLQPSSSRRPGAAGLPGAPTQEQLQRQLERDEAAAAARAVAVGRQVGGELEDDLQDEVSRDAPLYVPADLSAEAWGRLAKAAAAEEVPGHTLLVMEVPQVQQLAAAVQQEAAAQVMLDMAAPDPNTVGALGELIRVPERWRVQRSTLQPDAEYLSYCNSTGVPLVSSKAADCILPVEEPAAAAPVLHLRPEVMREKPGDEPVTILSSAEKFYAWKDQGRFDWADAPTWEEHEAAAAADQMDMDWSDGEAEEGEEEEEDGEQVELSTSEEEEGSD